MDEDVRAYWKCAVTERGCFATGGQTAGEVWMPKGKIKARLGDKNQEHCTVYNMMRLAEFLFRHTGEPEYQQYIEYNLYNGVMAQTYYQEYHLVGNKHLNPNKGLLTYFLPMKAGLCKDWSGETDSFFCCHGTMVQANAALNRGIYYEQQKVISICQYFDSELKLQLEGKEVLLKIIRDNMSGSMLYSSDTAGHQEMNEVTAKHENMPDYRKYDIHIGTDCPLDFTIALRIPEWLSGEAIIYLNDTLHGNISKEIVRENEREWGTWRYFFKAHNQDPVIDFRRIRDIGYEPFQIYYSNFALEYIPMHLENSIITGKKIA